MRGASIAASPPTSSTEPPCGQSRTPTSLFAARALLALQLLEGLARVAEGVDPRRHAAIDRDLQQDFLDLVPGQAVLQRALDVQLQFVGPVERAEHRKIYGAPGSRIEPRPRPQCAQQNSVDHSAIVRVNSSAPAMNLLT